MTQLIVTASLWMVLLPVIATAQAVEGWAAGGVGRWANDFTSGGIVQGAGGVEVRTAGLIGVAGGAGILFAGDLVVPLSLDGVWHAKPPSRAGGADPFIALGFVSLNGRQACQIRGGVNYWRRPTRALRLELQWMTRPDFPTRIVSANIGVTFR